VVTIGGLAIAIAGNSGVGKSTTAAALAKQGYAVLSDDIAVLEERDRQWLALPGYPRLRLWPEAIEALCSSETGLVWVFSFSEKRFVDLTEGTSEAAWRFQNQPLPLVAIYILGARRVRLIAPVIKPTRSTIAVRAALLACRALNYLQGKHGSLPN